MDKRKFVREFTTSPIKFIDAEGAVVFKGTVNDISAAGILAVSYDLEDFEGLNVNDEIGFIMSIPTGDVAGVAEVVWMDGEKSRMGLKFIKIVDKASVANLMSFVAAGFFHA